VCWLPAASQGCKTWNLFTRGPASLPSHQIDVILPPSQKKFPRTSKPIGRWFTTCTLCSSQRKQPSLSMFSYSLPSIARIFDFGPTLTSTPAGPSMTLCLYLVTALISLPSQVRTSPPGPRRQFAAVLTKEMGVVGVCVSEREEVSAGENREGKEELGEISGRADDSPAG
jgi:hypothetical protein